MRMCVNNFCQHEYVDKLKHEMKGTKEDLDAAEDKIHGL